VGCDGVVILVTGLILNSFNFERPDIQLDSP
jgi:hypothetical protein